MPRFREHIPLSKFSHNKIGGPAQFFFAAKTEKELVWAVREAGAKKLPVFVLAGGTNVLIGDEGFAGLVIHPDIQFMKATKNVVSMGAGVSMEDLLEFASKKSLSGLEWAGGLPGTLGGAIRGNAGCFGGEIKDVIRSVRSLDVRTMKIIERSAKECAFRYRDSVFKKKNGKEIIISATLALRKGKKEAIKRSIKEKIVYRFTHHPLEYPNLGSTFKNIALAQIHPKGSPLYKNALKESRLHFKGASFSVKTDPVPVISAAKLISETGLRGVSSGGAMISAKHPNFIVNALDARADDVKGLIELAKMQVKRKFGVTLEEEIQII